MGAVRALARGGLICLLLVPAALDARRLIVNSHRDNSPGYQPEEYFLLPNYAFSGLPRDPRERYRKIINNLSWGPHPRSDDPILRPGFYYIFPVCGHGPARRLIMDYQPISQNVGAVSLRCQ